MIKRQKVQKSVANINGINMEKNRQSSFLNLEKQKVINATVRHLIDNAQRHYLHYRDKRLHM